MFDEKDINLYQETLKEIDCDFEINYYPDNEAIESCF